MLILLVIFIWDITVVSCVIDVEFWRRSVWHKRPLDEVCVQSSEEPILVQMVWQASNRDMDVTKSKGWHVNGPKRTKERQLSQIANRWNVIERLYVTLGGCANNLSGHVLASFFWLKKQELFTAFYCNIVKWWTLINNSW